MVTERGKCSVASLLALALFACTNAEHPVRGEDGDEGAASSAQDDANDDANPGEDGDEADNEADDGSPSEGGDPLKYDLGPLLDSPPEPPDPFPVAPLGCEDRVPPGPILEIDGAGAFLAEDGLIRVRLVDEGPEHRWDIRFDLPPARSLPADYPAVEFDGDLSQPARWEWWHGSITGAVALTLVRADEGGCLIAELTASDSDWAMSAPPLGWLVTPLSPWP